MPRTTARILRVVSAAVCFGVAALSTARQAAAQTKVACVGDSITAGAGSTAGNDYPAVLGRLLGAAWQVRNFGNSGKTMMKMPSDPPGESYWLQPTYPASKAYGAAVVVIMLGTNDSKTANWRGGNNQYDADYRAMIAEFQALPSKPKVYAVLPPPSTMPSFTIDGAVIKNAIVPIIRKIAADIPGVGLIDVFDAFGSMPMQYLSGDGVHPNDKGHALLAQTVAMALTAAPGADGGAADGGADATNDLADARTSDAVDAMTDSPTMGTGGASGSGGTTGPMADAGSGGAAVDGAAPTGITDDNSGCGCRSAGNSAAGWFALVLLAGVIVGPRRRR